ncbi:MAG: outer membrane protein assembly factor BamE (lipoprotein component of BamABCDE complex) [Shewanella sp.]
MKTNLIGLAFIGAVSLGLSGCVINVGEGDSDWNSWERTQSENRDNLTKLNLGMSQDQVNVLMGKADFYEAYIHNEKEVHVLFYRTQRNSGDGKTTKDECTPVVISNNSLVGWGERAYLSI